MIRWGIIVGNLALLIAIGAFVLSNRSASQTIRSGTVNSLSTTTRSLANPLDQLSSDQIALQAAQMAKLPELTMVRNRADSAAALLAVVPNDTSTLSKPQVVNTAQKSRFDILQYRVKAGDTIASLARKFHINANSIRWSNNLDGNSLRRGATMLIPPAEGIVYRVTVGDTIDGIVNRYQANRNTFITVNDAENDNLRVGELVWIPNAIQPVATTNFANGLNFRAGAFSPPKFGAYYYTGPCTPNGYDCGWCTWWVAHRRAQIGSPLPTNLGDAYSWATAADQQRMPVSFKPQAGAVVWFTGANHVGFVESVKKNGDVIMSEMNAAGFNVVNTRVIPASQVGNYKYIY